MLMNLLGKLFFKVLKEHLIITIDQDKNETIFIKFKWATNSRTDLIAQDALTFTHFHLPKMVNDLTTVDMRLEERIAALEEITGS